MTSPSVPTAEEFAKARHGLPWLACPQQHKEDGTHYGMETPPCPRFAAYRAVDEVLASAEAAIERLSKERDAVYASLREDNGRQLDDARRWRAVRDRGRLIVQEAWREWWLQTDRFQQERLNPNQRNPTTADEAADRLAGVSPPESEKPR